LEGIEVIPEFNQAARRMLWLQAGKEQERGNLMLNRCRHEWHIFCLVAFAVLTITASMACRRSPGSRQSEPWESRIFKKYVLEPIPKSVADIKVHELDVPGLGRRHVMRFKIEKNDVTLILNSRAFREFDSVSYNELGYLTWHGAPNVTVDPAEGPQIVFGGGAWLPLYTKQRQQDEPEWFNPNALSSPKAYVLTQRHGKSTRDLTKVLVFDEDTEEAYFVEYLQGH
jgi:hypothetical protein